MLLVKKRIMLALPSIKFNNKISQSNQTKPKYSGLAYLSLQKNDSIAFGSKLSIGSCPKELLNVDIAALNKYSENVLEINDIGYLAEILKYFKPNSRKTYAIKRVWSSDKAKQQSANPIEQMRVEAGIYKKIKRLKNIPKFYYYKGNFNKGESSLLDNYLIMSWVDGKTVSKKGVFYDFSLVDSKKIKKIYNMMLKFDNAGVIHNDLWAGNILFTKKGVNIVDFNRSYVYNAKDNFKENNLSSFKTRFLNRYFSDVYRRQGENAYFEVYKDCLKSEINYYKSKQTYYSRVKNSKGESYYKGLGENLALELSDSELMKQNAIKTVFNTDVNCAEVFSKYFELGEDEAGLHFKKALDVLNNHPGVIGRKKSNLLKSNIMLILNLNKAMIVQDGTKMELINDSLRLLNNEKIYTKEEQKKLYYINIKRFCEFNVKHKQMKDSGQNTNALKLEYEDLFKNKRLKEYMENL